MTPLLEVAGLQVRFPGAAGEVAVVRDLALRLGAGESLGVVGESGCGKSMTALALLGLVPRPGRIAAGSIRLDGRELVGLPTPQLRRIRGRDVGMVFQEPMTSLNPVFSVGYQVAEALRSHQRLPRRMLRRRCLELLAEVGISEPEARLRAYPGELSGGMRQRVMLACACACRPRLLVADEPTTALDVTIQAQIMALLGRLRREHEMALLLITHDLGLVAQHVERVAVMYAGYVVEEAETRELFAEPLHPYTRGLMDSVPGIHGRASRLQPIRGTVPSPEQVPDGCPFRDRCPRAVAACAAEVPALENKRGDRRARCIRVAADV